MQLITLLVKSRNTEVQKHFKRVPRNVPRNILQKIRHQRDGTPRGHLPHQGIVLTRRSCRERVIFRNNIVVTEGDGTRVHAVLLLCLDIVRYYAFCDSCEL